jgi:hypothetical protein
MSFENTVKWGVATLIGVAVSAFNLSLLAKSEEESDIRVNTMVGQASIAFTVLGLYKVFHNMNSEGQTCIENNVYINSHKRMSKRKLARERQSSQSSDNSEGPTLGSIVEDYERQGDLTQPMLFKPPAEPKPPRRITISHRTAEQVEMGLFPDNQDDEKHVDKPGSRLDYIHY